VLELWVECERTEMNHSMPFLEGGIMPEEGKNRNSNTVAVKIWRKLSAQDKPNLTMRFRMKILPIL